MENMDNWIIACKSLIYKAVLLSVSIIRRYLRRKAMQDGNKFPADWFIGVFNERIIFPLVGAEFRELRKDWVDAFYCEDMFNLYSA